MGLASGFARDLRQDTIDNLCLQEIKLRADLYWCEYLYTRSTEAPKMFRSTVDGRWHQTEWCRTRRKLVKASTHMWNQMEYSRGREKLVTHYGHVASRSWHYPPINILSLVQKFWCQRNRGCGGSWDGCHQLNRCVWLHSSDGGFCNQSCYVPMSSTRDTALCSDR